MKISLVSLGQTGAGPVYSLEMAKALSLRHDCELQVIISSNTTNLAAWNEFFNNTKVNYHVIDTYERTKRSVIMNRLNYIKMERLVRMIKDFNADILYMPFGLMWKRYVYWRLHNYLHIVSTLHDVEFHDSWRNLSIAELGSYLLNYGAERFVDGYVILNRKDFEHVKRQTGKEICVIPHASFSYYFNNNDVKSYNIIHKCIGFFGRIEKYKGLDVLVDAFEKTKTVGLKLLIAGSGKIEEELLVRINSNSNIELINRYIKDEEFEGLLNQVDFTVLPYKRASQSGVIPMCFAAGKTVVATNVGALSEQVPKGTGIITEVNAELISEEIDALYLHEDKIFEYGKNAKMYAETELSWNSSAEKLVDFFKKIKKCN